MSVEGFDNVINKMKLHEENIRSAVLSTMGAGMNEIADRAKFFLTENHHVKTGNLRRSVKGEARQVSLTVIEGQVGTNVHYAPYVEALPDGGYLYRSVQEKIPVVEMKIVTKLKALLK